MEEEKGGDIRVPLISCLFCLCLLTGGILLVLYVFFPNLSQPWFPFAAFTLIGCPWLFWFLVFIYTCMKRCFGFQTRRLDVEGQISRRPPGSNHGGSVASSSRNGGFSSQQGGARQSSVRSSKECETPLTSSV